ncbi:MAG: AI-2E family transporter [Christensenellales bacterium]
MPTFIADLQGLYNELVTWLQEVLRRLPAEYAGVGDEIFSLLNSAWEWLKTLLSGALGYVMGISRNVALEVPSFVIFLTVLVLASCIITADFPNLRENIYGYLGVRGKNSVRLMGHSFRAAVFGFFRSQLIFALLDMGIILVAFFIIGVSYPLPIALLLAFLDFIPFFGAGTVLVPWGLICMAIGLFDMGSSCCCSTAFCISSAASLSRAFSAARRASLRCKCCFPCTRACASRASRVWSLPRSCGSPRQFPENRRAGRLPRAIFDLSPTISVKTVARPVPTKTQEPPAARAAAKAGEKKKRFSFGRKSKIDLLSTPVLRCAGTGEFFALCDDNRLIVCYNGIHLKTNDFRVFPRRITIDEKRQAPAPQTGLSAPLGVVHALFVYRRSHRPVRRVSGVPRADQSRG